MLPGFPTRNDKRHVTGISPIAQTLEPRIGRPLGLTPAVLSLASRSHVFPRVISFILTAPLPQREFSPRVIFILLNARPGVCHNAHR